MVSVVQLVERQIVVLVVVGSSPTVHPAKRVSLRIDSFFCICTGKIHDRFSKHGLNEKSRLICIS